MVGLEFWNWENRSAQRRIEPVPRGEHPFLVSLSFSRWSLEPAPRRVFRNASRNAAPIDRFPFWILGRRFLSAETLSQKLRSSGCFAKFQPRIFAAPLQLVKGELVSWFRHVSSTKCSSDRSPLSSASSILFQRRNLILRSVLGERTSLSEILVGYFSPSGRHECVERCNGQLNRVAGSDYGICLKIKFSVALRVKFIIEQKIVLNGNFFFFFLANFILCFRHDVNTCFESLLVFVANIWRIIWIPRTFFRSRRFLRCDKIMRLWR